MKSSLHISVVGLGYIGLPTALLLAQNKNFLVSGFDVSKEKISTLEKGKLPFDENGLQALLSKVKKQKNFVASTELQSSDVYLIAVPTPQENGHSDLTYVMKALELIKPVAQKNALIILESTVAPEDCQTIQKLLKKWPTTVHFAHCPERAIPGNTLYEMVNNTRIIGVGSPQAKKIASEVYSSFVKGQLKYTDPVTAACVKVMENTFRAVNIALANELLKISYDLGINIWEAIELANAHPRVNIHSPGPGVGGHCIPIDPWFFVGPHADAKLIPTALKINDSMPQFVVDLLLKKSKESKKPIKKVVVLGVAYKKDVDDWRESPAEAIIQNLEKKFEVIVTDPLVKNFTHRIHSFEEALKNADAAILVTDHSVYKKADFKPFKKLQFVIDTRNCLKKNQFSTHTVLETVGNP